MEQRPHAEHDGPRVEDLAAGEMPHREHHRNRIAPTSKAESDLEPGRLLPQVACDQVVQKDEDQDVSTHQADRRRPFRPRARELAAHLTLYILAAGSVNQNVAPCSTRLAHTRPPCMATSRWTVASPMPLPSN